MRNVGKLVRQNDQVFFLGRVIKRTVRGYSVEANPKYLRDVIAVLGLEEAKPVTTPSVKRTPTTESLAELENERRAVQNRCGKTAVHVSRTGRHHLQRERNSTKIICPTESDEMNVKRIVKIPERRSECKVPDRNGYTPEVRERVHRQ